MIHILKLSTLGIAVVAAMLGGALQPTPSHAQSFSCANAQIPSEMAVCNIESLLVKDERVADLLAARLVSASRNENGIQTVSRDHSAWLQQRNACLADVDCLEKAYDDQIEKLVGRDL